MCDWWGGGATCVVEVDRGEDEFLLLRGWENLVEVDGHAK